MKRLGLFIALLVLGQFAISQTLRSLNPSVIGSFSEGLAKVKKDGKWGFVDKNMNVVIRVQYDEARDFKEGLAAVERNDKYGFIDKKGNVVIPIQYDYAHAFSEGLAKVSIDGLWGYIDKTGKEVIPLQFIYETLDFSDGLAVVIDNEDGQNYGFIDKSGKYVIPPSYVYYDNIGAAPFSEGLAMVNKDGKYGFIDKKGNVTIPFQYDNASSFSEGFAAVSKDGKCGYVNKKGDVVISMQFDYAADFSEGMAAVMNNDEWGFIDRQGDIVIPFQYHSLFIPSFHEGMAMVVKDAKCGYIDKQGKIVIPIQYDFNFYPQALPFSEGFAAVRKDEKWFYIEKNNSTVGRSIVEMKDEYVDLGLPSGTLWYGRNEDGYFTFGQAESRFRGHLPSSEQFNELMKKCKWEWTNGGYIVTGPNNNSIFLPAKGYIENYNNPKGEKVWDNISGHYWGSKKYGKFLTEFRFAEKWTVINHDADGGSISAMDGASVRLVRTK